MSRARNWENPCDQIRNLLSQYLDGELEPGRRDEVQQHLRICGRCEGIAEGLRDTIGLAHRYGQVQAPEHLRQRLGRMLKIAGTRRQET